MRVLVEAARGVVDADGLQHGEAAGQRVWAGDFFVDQQRFDELLTDAQVGVERGHRILENHADAPAADGAQLAGRAAEEVNAVEHRRAGFDPRGRRRQQAEQREAGDGLARAGFADETERLAALQRKTHAVHGTDDPVARVEARAEVRDSQERHGGSAE